LWILAQPKKRPLVMSANAVVPYYAEGDLSLFPWNESSIALRFIHKRRPDYLVLRTAERSHAPYIESWLANGIPDPCAKEIHRMVEEPGRDLVVYRWDCGLAEH
jgi:hypothetical protein